MAVRPITLKNGEKRYEAYFNLEGIRYQKRFATKAEAREWEIYEKRRLKDLSQGLTFSQASDEYLQDCQKRISANAFQEKFRHLREFATFMQLSDFCMEQVTVDEARHFMNFTQEARGNKSANRRLRTLKALWNWCRHTVPVNPWREVKQFPEEEFVKYVPPAEDISKVFAAAEEWEKDLLLLLVHTGARISEILNLRWSDVTQDNIVLWTKKRKNGSRQPRNIPIGDSLKELLNRYEEKRTGIYVLVNPITNGPYKKSQHSIKLMLERLCKKAGVKVFGFHSLRHYFASCLLSTGRAGLADIQLLLGHQRMSTTDGYLHSLNPMLGHLAGIIEDMNADLK